MKCSMANPSQTSIVVFLATAAIFLAARAAPAATIETTYPFRGVTHYHYISNTPRLVDVHILKIDPTAQGIGFRTTPSNGATAGETVVQTTRSFVSQNGLQIGINANFYS